MFETIIIITLDISLITLLLIYVNLKKPINNYYNYLKENNKDSYQDIINNIKVQNKLIKNLKFKIFFLKLANRMKGMKNDY